MAQTLIAQTAVSNPAKPSDAKALMANCAALGNLNPRQLKAIAIISLVYSAKGFVVDYSNNLSGLTRDALAFTAPFALVGYEASLLRKQMDTAMIWYDGYSADSTLGTDVVTIMGKGKRFLAMPEESLDRIILFLRYLLGQ